MNPGLESKDTKEEDFVLLQIVMPALPTNEPFFPTWNSVGLLLLSSLLTSALHAANAGDGHAAQIGELNDGILLIDIKGRSEATAIIKNKLEEIEMLSFTTIAYLHPEKPIWIEEHRGIFARDLKPDLISVQLGASATAFKDRFKRHVAALRDLENPSGETSLPA